MKHPEPEKIRTVARRLLNASREYPGEVNMTQSDVGKDHLCKTTACHAGWYLLAKMHEAGEARWEKEDEEGGYHSYSLRNGNGEYRGFTEGVNAVTQDLGFDEYEDVKDWAEKHPELWGNPYGSGMFSSPRAFGGTYEKELTVKDIAAHWLAVADRIEALNKPKVETGSWSEIESLTGWSVLDNV